jgi:hypothetical protein
VVERRNPETIHPPVGPYIYVVRLAAPEYRVEVDAWACRA